MTDPIVQAALDRHYAACVTVFGDGQSCYRRGGYWSHNPHEHGSADWRMWAMGFAEERGQAAILEEKERG